MKEKTPILILTAILFFQGCVGGGEQDLDLGRMEAVEELSESLANDLLALSIALRKKDLHIIQTYLGETVQGPSLPVRAGQLEPLVKWISLHGWTGDDLPPRSRGREEILSEIEILLNHFPVLEDARIKVKEAEFPEEGKGRARISLFLIGRDTAGRREWCRGWGRIEVVRQGEGNWRIRSLALDGLESQVAEMDLFSEVALPAGVAAIFPPFGVAPNLGFASHGVAAADVNNDGLLDIAATGVDTNYLYLNLGDGRFRDISKESLVAYAPPGTGPVFLDFDNDGDQDLFFAAVGKQVLMENRPDSDGEIRFWNISDLANVDVSTVGFSAVAADVNGDGFTDIYVASYNRYGEVFPNKWYRATNGTKNLLLINQGDGTFLEAGADWGVDDGRWSYAAGFIDLDGDFDQDLYVANDFGENALYRNDGDHFTEVAEQFGLVDPGFGMGVSFGDFDNDGDLDLHVTNMSSSAGARILGRLSPTTLPDRELLNKLAAGNSLYENLGGGEFLEVAARSGILAGGWAFGGGFIDFDNDGWEDLYSPNGFISGKSMKDT